MMELDDALAPGKVSGQRSRLDHGDNRSLSAEKVHDAVDLAIGAG